MRDAFVVRSVSYAAREIRAFCFIATYTHTSILFHLTEIFSLSPLLLLLTLYCTVNMHSRWLKEGIRKRHDPSATECVLFCKKPLAHFNSTPYGTKANI